MRGDSVRGLVRVAASKARRDCPGGGGYSYYGPTTTQEKERKIDRKKARVAQIQAVFLFSLSLIIRKKKETSSKKN